MLTHDQAAYLRGVSKEWQDYRQPEGLKPFLSGKIVGQESRRILSPEGEAALAEYDAKYMVVERVEHQRLTSLENKIEDFLDWSMLGDNQLEVGEEGGLCVRWVKSWNDDPDNGYWVVDDTALPPTEDAWPYHVGGRGYCGDAMREAFRIWCAKWDAAHADEQEPSEYVSVRREHLEELRDTANASYLADKAMYEGRSNLLANLEPTRLAIEHADAVLRGEQ
jgi:hypothetical protein